MADINSLLGKVEMMDRQDAEMRELENELEFLRRKRNAMKNTLDRFIPSNLGDLEDLRSIGIMHTNIDEDMMRTQDALIDLMNKILQSRRDLTKQLENVKL